jgi:hypothetical protein
MILIEQKKLLDILKEQIDKDVDDDTGKEEIKKKLDVDSNDTQKLIDKIDLQNKELQSIIDKNSMKRSIINS